MNESQFLIEQSQQINVHLSSSQVEQLLHYVNLLEKWNKVYNLTSINDRHQILTHHILDGLTVVPYLQLNSLNTCADIGSGNGIPGIIIAITNAAHRITLIDSNQKKTTFLQQVITELALNAQVICARVEHVKNTFDLIIARAFAPVDKTIAIARHIIAPNGRLICMFGKNIPDNQHNLEYISLKIPGCNDVRSIGIMHV
jgi:16S rRNA (guanine527-N7)-methyltransferase